MSSKLVPVGRPLDAMALVRALIRKRMNEHGIVQVPKHRSNEI